MVLVGHYLNLGDFFVDSLVLVGHYLNFSDLFLDSLVLVDCSLLWINGKVNYKQYLGTPYKAEFLVPCAVVLLNASST